MREIRTFHKIFLKKVQKYSLDNSLILHKKLYVYLIHYIKINIYHILNKLMLNTLQE